MPERVLSFMSTVAFCIAFNTNDSLEAVKSKKNENPMFHKSGSLYTRESNEQLPITTMDASRPRQCLVSEQGPAVSCR